MKFSRKHARHNINVHRDTADEKLEQHAGQLAIEAEQEAPATQSKLEIVTNKHKTPITETQQHADFKVVDRRRNTPQSVEAVFQAEQELLRAPLNPAEQQQAIARLMDRQKFDHVAAKRAHDTDPTRHDMSKKAERAAAQVRIDDMEGDSRALNRLSALVNGDYIARGDDQHNQSRGLNISERLDDLVKHFAALVPEKFETEGSQYYIASSGGSVNIGENGQVHFGGYNNSLLYEFARARQIWGAIEDDPKRVRDEILPTTNTDELDVDWIMAQPVAVTAEDTARPLKEVIL